MDRIIYKFIPEEAQRTISLESGDVDFVYDPPLTELEGLMNNSDYDVLEVKTSSTPSLYFNSSEGSVCSNKSLRQAISCAIDNSAIVAAVYKGFAHPACSVVTPNNPEWSDDLENSNPYAFDQEKAKTCLAEAGYQPGELKLRLATDDVSTHKAAAEIIQAYLQQIGIEVEISIFDGIRKIPIHMMSRGTIEQIYFAVRMAASEILYEEPLPIILDDTFAYYDDKRMEAALRWLAGQKKQVLLFTCQNREKEALDHMHLAYRDGWD